MSPRKLRRLSDDEISEFLQLVLKIRKSSRVTAVDAAKWLDCVGILSDSPQRPGLPLRKRLRAGGIRGQHQESNGRWYIEAIQPTRGRSGP